MRLPRGGNREDIPRPGAVGAPVLPVALLSALDEAEVKRRSRQGNATAPHSLIRPLQLLSTVYNRQGNHQNFLSSSFDGAIVRCFRIPLPGLRQSLPTPRKMPEVMESYPTNA